MVYQQLPIDSRTGRDLYAIIDQEDFERFAQYRWRLSSRGYAIRSYVDEGKEIVLSLPREVLQPPPGLQADHINRDRLDDRRENLRILSPSLRICPTGGASRIRTTGFQGCDLSPPQVARANPEG